MSVSASHAMEMLLVSIRMEASSVPVIQGILVMEWSVQVKDSVT